MNLPKGIYASSGALESGALNNASCRGVLIRAKWSDIESTQGVFDFSALDRQITSVKAAGKKYSLGILAGPFAPSWLVNKPSLVTIASPRGPIPVWWDSRVIDALSALATALGNKYAADASLSLVYVPQMTCNGIEGHFNGVGQSSLLNAGYTVDNFVSSAESTIDKFAAMFTKVPTAIEYHTILNSNEHVQQLMEYTLGTYVGAAIWWINGATNYQADLLTIVGNYAGDKYAQLLDKSSNAASFPNGYAAVFSQAQSLGIRYIEPWDYEFTLVGNLWGPTFDSFNTWSDKTF